MDSLSRRCCVCLSVFVLFVLVSASEGGITGHSGIVMHVNKYGHFSGHSSHYDYRFYPEKSLLDHLIDHHHPYSPSLEDGYPYNYLEDHSYHGEHDPLYYYQHDHYSR
ncbi:hypothetical protein CEXT_288581 [Caerostris extrusa]|uniref:Uncharacterized protein n=1 Tax=Caerostris extrusa TaxID=172846 RepID=A0AAV4S4F8_CAEEX|nr:hypothetical protein CEXT_288581 [Caerostris extrusa]